MSSKNESNSYEEDEEDVSLAADLEKVVGGNEYEFGAALAKKLNDFISSKIDKIASAAATKATKDADEKWEKAWVTYVKDTARMEFDRLEHAKSMHACQLAERESTTTDCVSIIQECVEALGSEKALREAAFVKIEEYRVELDALKQNCSELVDAYRSEKALRDAVLKKLKASEQTRIEMESKLPMITQHLQNIKASTVANATSLSHDIRSSISTLDQSTSAIKTSAVLGISRLEQLIGERKTNTTLPSTQAFDKHESSLDNGKTNLLEAVESQKPSAGAEFGKKKNPSTPARVELAKNAKISVLESGTWMDISPTEVNLPLSRASIKRSGPRAVFGGAGRYQVSAKTPISNALKASTSTSAAQHVASSQRSSTLRVPHSPLTIADPISTAGRTSAFDNGHSETYSLVYARREPRLHPTPTVHSVFSVRDGDKQEEVIVQPKLNSKVRETREGEQSPSSVLLPFFAPNTTIHFPVEAAEEHSSKKAEPSPVLIQPKLNSKVRKSREDRPSEPSQKRAKLTHTHGTWVKIHIGYGNKNFKSPFKHPLLKGAPISDEFKERISLADFQDPDHRNNSRAANQHGRRLCWNADAAISGYAVAGVPSTETSPYGMCLEKLKTKGSCECFYFGKKLDDIWVFSV